MDETTLVSNNNVFYNFLNTLYDIFLFLSIMGFSFVISMNIVSTLVYRPMLKWNDSKNIRDEDSEYNENSGWCIFSYWNNHWCRYALSALNNCSLWFASSDCFNDYFLVSDVFDLFETVKALF